MCAGRHQEIAGPGSGQDGSRRQHGVPDRPPGRQIDDLVLLVFVAPADVLDGQHFRIVGRKRVGSRAGNLRNDFVARYSKDGERIATWHRYPTRAP